MKTPFSLLKISALATSALLLTACIDDDDDSSSDHDHGHEEHAHSLMISRTTTTDLAVLEEGAPEALETAAAANSAELLLSNTGEAAAVITAGSVQFVVAHHEEEEEGEEEAHDEEEHELPEVSSLQIDGTGIKVANTNGHFSVLATGTTQFVPYESLEEGATPEAEDVAYTVAEEYPALLLHEDETHGLLTLVFDGTNAVVYEGATASVEAEHTVACDALNSTAHVGEFAVVSCDNATFSVKVEESGDEHEAEITTIAGISTAVEWKSRAGVFVGLGADNKFYVLEEENEALVLEGTAFDAPENMCTWGIDSLQADIYTLTATQFSVYTHEGTLDGTPITLDETLNTADCEDLVMATATQAAFVLDNATPKMYEIDKEEDATAYHIHGREDLSVQDVKSAVSFHEVGEEAGHAHSHD